MWVTELAGRLARSICRITVTAIRSSQASRVFLRRDSCERRIHQKGRLQLNEGQIEKKKNKAKKKEKRNEQKPDAPGYSLQMPHFLKYPVPYPKSVKILFRFASSFPTPAPSRCCPWRQTFCFVLFCLAFLLFEPSP